MRQMLEADFSSVIASLAEMVARMHDTSPVMERIGAAELLEAQQRIIGTKIGSDHEPWQPWRARTQQERAEKGNASQGLLWDTGTLLHSLGVEVSASGVLIGSDVDYAIDLQDGTDIMDARPFLGWDAETLPEYAGWLTAFIEYGSAT